MSTEVKPNDWNEGDNRWEPTPSGGGGGGVPTPTSSDVGKALTAAEKTVSQTIMPEYSATFDNTGYTTPTNITIDPTAIPSGTIGTLHIGGNSYELAWVPDGGNGNFGDPNGPDPCLGVYDGTWYIDYGPHSQTVTVSMTADIQSGEFEAKWVAGNVLLAFTDATAVASAVSNAITAALSAQDYLLHAGSSSKAFTIPATSGVTADAFSAAVSAAVDNNKALVVNVEGLGVFNATFFGTNPAGATAQVAIPSYDAVFGYVTLFLELYVANSVLKGNVYAQQIKMPN